MPSLQYTTRISTVRRITVIENWLDQNISGAWSVSLEDVSEDMEKKTYILSFENEADRAFFRMRFKPAKPVAPRGAEELRDQVSDKTKSLIRKTSSVLSKVRSALGRLLTPLNQQPDP
ncbi:MAG: hypothetical protein RIF37_04355 [Rhodospirillaceae bacterium]